jgi:O-antigen/teichoic acid export membrane protein
VSVASRIVSGSAASWARMGLTFVAQFAIVPIFLAFWSVETFGVWIAIQAFVSMLTTFDFGYQTYLEYEFLKIGAERKDILRKHFWSGIGVGWLISILQVLLVYVMLKANLISEILGQESEIEPSLMKAATLVLFIEASIWLVFKSAGGLLYRVLAPLGYYPRGAWWGVFDALISTLFPATIVILGGDLLHAGIAVAVGAVVTNGIILYDLLSILKKEDLWFTRPSTKTGWVNFTRSFPLSGKIILESIRQQGVRVVLAPLSGASGLAAFSTMRTGSNIVLQGLNTISYPLMPELMKFIGQRDQERCNAAFGILWIFLIGLLAPAVLILQVMIEPVFELWTQGKIEFNPALFALLSLSVLLYAISQPAIAVVRGNNLVKVQLIFSALTAVIIVGGMILLIPSIGILGAAVSLLIAETVSMIGYYHVAMRWMKDHGLSWPRNMDKFARFSVLVSAISLLMIVAWKPYELYILLFSTVAFAIVLLRFWRELPDIFVQRLTTHIRFIYRK